jgi:hypothetical protein
LQPHGNLGRLTWVPITGSYFSRSIASHGFVFGTFVGCGAHVYRQAVIVHDMAIQFSTVSGGLRNAALALSLVATAAGSAQAFGIGGAAAVGGVADPLKYYPICRHGLVAQNCQCRIGSSSQANQLCQPGQSCDTRNGICGPGRTPNFSPRY